MTKRAALIITDASLLDVEGWGDGFLYMGKTEDVPTSEQLLADLRTLARFPDLLRLDDDPPSILETPVTVSNADLLSALEAADCVRALLPKGGSMSIKRYDLGADGLGNWWQCSEDGEFVRYEDHAAEVERLREALLTIAGRGPVFDAKGTHSKRVCDIARAALTEEGDE